MRTVVANVRAATEHELFPPRAGSCAQRPRLLALGAGQCVIAQPASTSAWRIQLATTNWVTRPKSRRPHVVGPDLPQGEPPVRGRRANTAPMTCGNASYKRRGANQAAVKQGVTNVMRNII